MTSREIKTREEWLEFCSGVEFDPESSSVIMLVAPKDGEFDHRQTQVAVVNQFGQNIEHVLFLLRLITHQPSIQEIAKAYHDALVSESFLDGAKRDSGLVAARAVPSKLR